MIWRLCWLVQVCLLELSRLLLVVLIWLLLYLLFLKVLLLCFNWIWLRRILWASDRRRIASRILLTLWAMKGGQWWRMLNCVQGWLRLRLRRLIQELGYMQGLLAV